MKKQLLLLFLLSLSFTAHAIEIKLSQPTLSNAQTLLLTIEDMSIQKPKLSLKNLHLDFKKNPFKEQYYALLPISYYESFKSHRLIFSYIQNEKKIFKGENIKVIEGDYKHEKLTVSKSKIELSKASQQRIKKEYKEAMKIYKTITPSLHWTKDFIEPMSSIKTSPFGTKRVFNGITKSYHSGVDYRAKVGEDIIAVNDGVVKLVSNRFYAGGSIVIDHGHGVYSCYFHLSDFNVKVNQKVSQGQKIGLSGATGRITGPHLHFAMKVHGVTVDPLQTMTLLNELNNTENSQ